MLINDASITGSLIVNASSSFQNIAVSGNILPGTNNVYNLGSVDKFFKEIFVSTGSINFVDNTGIKTTISSVAGGGIQIGSVQITTSSISFVDITGSVTQTIAQSSSLGSTSNFTPTSSFNAYTQSFSSSVSTSFSSSLASVTSLSSSVSSSVTSLSSSLTSVNTTQNSRLTTIESVTGSYETNGRGIVSGSSQITYANISSIPSGIVSGSTQITPLLPTNVVSGSSQITYVNISSIPSGIISSSAQLENANITNLTITNLTTVNQTASVLFTSGSNRFGDFGDDTHSFTGSVKISGSFTLVGASTATSYNGTINATNGVVSGSSQIDLTTTTNYASGILTRLNAVGVFSGSSQVSLSGFNTSNLSENTNLYYTDARVKTKLNAETVVSGSKTISGITLGSNLATLTIGTGLSGTSYNGSTGVTIANSGVTSIVAGTGISINQGTAAVTVTNTITNNNQLTNGAGYITSAGNATNITAYTINQNVGTSNSPTFAGLTINTGGVSTWSPVVVQSTSCWGDGAIQYATIGAGAAGIMIFNPHVVWNGGNSAAAIRLGRSGGISTGKYYEIGTGASDNFFIAKESLSSGTQLNINSSGNATFSGTLSASNLSGTNTGDQTNISGNAATVTNGVYTNASNTLTNNLNITGGQGAGNTAAYSSAKRLIFDNDYTTTAKGPNKITLYDAGFLAGFGIHSSTVSYYSGDTHKWYKATTADNASIMMQLDGSGNFNATGDVTAYSDIRIKENIVSIIDPLNKVLRLRGVSYNRIDTDDKSTKIGFIAQEVEKIVPEVVTYDKEQDRYGVSYGNITALLVEAIKEQQIKIDNLTIEVENLKKPKGL